MRNPNQKAIRFINKTMAKAQTIGGTMPKTNAVPHTPTWVQGYYDGTDIYKDESKKELIAKVVSEEHAAHIVKCVNTISELNAYLEERMGSMSAENFSRGDIANVLDHVRQALARAEGAV